MFALGAILASCSKSDVTESLYENNPISFDVYNGRTPEVKATSIDATNVTNLIFQVIGEKEEQANLTTKYFNKRISYDNGWKPEQNYVAYWPSEALDFYAYSLNAGDEYLTAVDHTTGKLALTVPTIVDNQYDFLVASPKTDQTAASNNKTVKFSFAHMFSRMHFTLLTHEQNATVVQIKEIKVTGSFAGGCELNYKDATPSSTIAPQNVSANTTYSYLGDGAFFGTGKTGDPIYNNKSNWNDQSYTLNQGATEGTPDNSRYMMIVPTHNMNTDLIGQSHGAQITVKYQLKGSEEYTVTKDLKSAGADIPLMPGHSYNIILKVSLNTISFDVEVGQWTEYPANTSGTTIPLE